MVGKAAPVVVRSSRPVGQDGILSVPVAAPARGRAGLLLRAQVVARSGGAATCNLAA